MENIQLNPSDAISILALVVSILFGLGNIFYTRRTFLISTNPSVQLFLDTHLQEKPQMRELEGEYVLDVRVANLVIILL